MFTDNGKIFVRKVYRIPEASRTAKGSNIINLIEIEKGEKVTAMVTLSEFTHGEYLTMVTQNGVIKRTDIAEYEYQRKGGKIAINLDEGDKLIFVGHTDGTRHILIATKNGYAARFDENKVSVVGRTARGVRGIDLRKGDIVCGAVIVDNDKQLLTITENGYGKKSNFDEFEPRNRGILGVIAHNINEKTGLLASIACVDESKDVMLITNEGVIIRTATDVIPTYKRSTTGVKIMRLDDGAIVANTTLVDKEEEGEECETDENSVATESVQEVSSENEAVAENTEKTDTPQDENE
jgi:DNA gyrase subunit A